MPKKKTTSAKKKTAKTIVKKAAKKAVKKSATTKAAQKKPKNPVKKAVKASGEKAVKKTPGKAPKKKLVKKSAPTKTKPAESARATSSPPKKGSAEAKSAPVVFSLDDVEQLMAAKKSQPEAARKTPEKAPQKTPAPQAKKVVVEDAPVEQRKLGAASLSDILGFNPAEKKKNTELNSEEVPKKWKKYYKLLLELRAHVRDEIDLHSSTTLKHSSRDDSGDLSSYGSHQADVGTDSFDRDFALSLVSNEHEALNEIEDAIQRIKNGSYGMCEVTGKPIPAARLTAVPFARFSIEGQAEYEKNLRRKVDRSGNTGLFGDASDAPKLAANDDDE
ncbi:MAG: TraR/DksA C4-type zinc finger protein [Opitutales bacterium]